MAQYRDGARFVRAVVDKVGMADFNAVWAEPDNLPSLAEIHDPDVLGRPRPRVVSRALTDEPAPVARGRASRRTPRARRPRAGRPPGRGLQRRRRLARPGLGHGARGPRAGVVRRGRDRRPRAPGGLGRAGRAGRGSARGARGRRDGQRPGRGRGARPGTRGGRARGSVRPARPDPRALRGRGGPARPHPRRPGRDRAAGSRARLRRPGDRRDAARLRALPPAAPRRVAHATRSPPARSRGSRSGTTRTTATRRTPGCASAAVCCPCSRTSSDPGVTESLARTADQLRADMDLLDAYAERALAAADGRRRASRSRCWPAWRRRSGPGCCARRPSPPGPRRVRRSTSTSLAVDALVTDWHGQKWIDLPGRLRAVRRDGVLVFEAAVPPPERVKPRLLAFPNPYKRGSPARAGEPAAG